MDSLRWSENAWDTRPQRTTCWWRTLFSALLIPGFASFSLKICSFISSVLITFSGTFASEARVLSVVEESFPLRQIWGQGDQEATGKKSREEPWSHPKDCWKESRHLAPWISSTPKDDWPRPAILCVLPGVVGPVEAMSVKWTDATDEQRATNLLLRSTPENQIFSCSTSACIVHCNFL